VRRHRRDDGHLTFRDRRRLVADPRFTLAGEDEQNLLGAVGVGREVCAWIDLEVDDCGGCGTRAAVAGELNAQAGEVLHQVELGEIDWVHDFLLFRERCCASIIRVHWRAVK